MVFEVRLQLRYWHNLGQFYLAILGFTLFQWLAWYLATSLEPAEGQSHEGNDLAQVFVRLIFLALQMLLTVVFSEKLHLFQVQLILLSQANALLLVLKLPMDPISSFVLLLVLSYPHCKRAEKKHQKEILDAFDEDETLYFATNKPPKAAPDYG